MTSQSEPIILYDLPSNDLANHMPWSPNTWKARFALNYKQLAYKTEWVEFPDIVALCVQLGALPTGTKPDGSAHYTLPVIFDPRTRRVVADSTQIAAYLDDAYPDTQRLGAGGERDAALVALLWARVTLPLAKLVVARTCIVLNPQSAEYFRRTREGLFKARLEELATEEEWGRLKEGLRAVDEYLGKDEGEERKLGADEPGRITYGDIRIASTLMWARVVCGVDSKEWRQIVGMHGGKWGTFLERFKAYESVSL